MFDWLYNFSYWLVQTVLILLFKPTPPKPSNTKPYRGRVAIIGAGISGVGAAATAIAHGFDVVIYEEKASIGGIWRDVNSTSSLQLNSLLYRFHSAIRFTRGYPYRDEIVGQLEKVWKEYGLEPKTRFGVTVTKVSRFPPGSIDVDKHERSHWTVNDGADGIFDAVISSTGTCGEPNIIPIKLQNMYRGRVLHSADLDTLAPGELVGKSVVVVGSGASGVEAVETAVGLGANEVRILARHDKWFIPRSIFWSILVAAQLLGRPTFYSSIVERLLAIFHYRDLEALMPGHKGFNEDTPIVNGNFLDLIRKGTVHYTRGEILRFTPSGLLTNVRGEVLGKGVTATFARTSKDDGGRMSRMGDLGQDHEFQADVVVLATGFEYPPIDFLPEDLFPKGYSRPNLHLQNFSTEDWSVLLLNAAYYRGIGTIGHVHIEMFTRILLMFLMDEKTRPSPQDARHWVDFVRWMKGSPTTQGLHFFTYFELSMWIFTFVFSSLSRAKWAFFVMCGWGAH